MPMSPEYISLRIIGPMSRWSEANNYIRTNDLSGKSPDCEEIRVYPTPICQHTPTLNTISYTKTWHTLITPKESHTHTHNLLHKDPTHPYNTQRITHSHTDSSYTKSRHTHMTPKESHTHTDSSDTHKPTAHTQSPNYSELTQTHRDTQRVTLSHTHTHIYTHTHTPTHTHINTHQQSHTHTHTHTHSHTPTHPNTPTQTPLDAITNGCWTIPKL